MTLDGLPPEAKEYGLPGMRLLALCRQLQIDNLSAMGMGDFILPVRAACIAIGLNPQRDRMRVHRWLTRAFVNEGWIEVVECGDGRPGGLANVYRFIGIDHRRRDDPG